jgi:hypothetical protein
VREICHGLFKDIIRHLPKVTEKIVKNPPPGLAVLWCFRVGALFSERDIFLFCSVE